MKYKNITQLTVINRCLVLCIFSESSKSLFSLIPFNYYQLIRAAKHENRVNFLRQFYSELCNFKLSIKSKDKRQQQSKIKSLKGRRCCPANNKPVFAVEVTFYRHQT